MRKAAASPVEIERPVFLDDVREFLGRTGKPMSTAQAYNLMQKGVLPYHKVDGTRFFFLSEITAAIKAL